jgi:hypothetical protein
MSIFPVVSFSQTANNAKNKPVTQQDRPIVSGSVIDAKTGESLIGAVVMFNDLNEVATITDADGKFALQVPDNQKGTLTISSLGYKAKKVEIKGQKVILSPWMKMSPHWKKWW